MKHKILVGFHLPLDYFHSRMHIWALVPCCCAALRNIHMDSAHVWVACGDLACHMKSPPECDVSCSRSSILLVAAGAAGLGYLYLRYWCGLSLSDLMYVTKASLNRTVSASAEGEHNFQASISFLMIQIYPGNAKQVRAGIAQRLLKCSHCRFFAAQFNLSCQIIALLVWSRHHNQLQDLETFSVSRCNSRCICSSSVGTMQAVRGMRVATAWHSELECITLYVGMLSNLSSSHAQVAQQCCNWYQR